MMNIRSLLLLLFFAHHNVWTMNKDTYKVVVAQAALEGGTWKALRAMSSAENTQSDRKRLFPEIKRVIAEISTEEIKKRVAQETFLGSEEPDTTNDVAAQSATEPARKSAVTPMATRVRATSPAQQKQQAAKKKKKKKKSSSEDLDALLAEFAEKDAQQRPKSPLRSSPKINDQTITLDPDEDLLAINLFSHLLTADAMCVSCGKLTCMHRAAKSNIIKYTDRTGPLQFTRTPKQQISVRGLDAGWRLVARQDGETWNLTFNDLGHERVDTILKKLNTDRADQAQSRGNSFDDEGDDMYESDEEPNEDDVTKGTRTIIARLTASRANSVVLNRETNASAKWVNPATQEVIEYSKGGKVFFYIDVATETIIAL